MSLIDRLVGQRVYLDANIVIYHLIGYEPFRAPLMNLFELVDAGRCHAITSELTLAEVLVKPLRNGDVASRDRCRALLEGGGQFVLCPVSRPVLIAAAEIRAAGGLKLPDAIHFATAVAAGCKIFLTNDRRLRGRPDTDVLLLSELC